MGPGFSPGRTWCDGQQASHWKDNLGIGIMDPTAGTGERLGISGNDGTAFSAVGRNLSAVPVPVPETYAMFALGLVAIGWRPGRQRRG